MTDPITFDELQRALQNNDFETDELPNYFEEDEDSAVVSLKLRPDVISDDVPSSFDANEALHKYQRRQFETAQRDRPLGITVVAEGDSWFNLPQPWRPRAIVDNLENNHTYTVKNIARWGHTIERMLQEKEYLIEIDGSTKYFIFSGGGNDLQNALETLKAIHNYDPARPKDQYLTQFGIGVLEKIEDDIYSLLAEVRRSFGHVKMLTHSYDYPRPLVKRDKYIGRYLREHGVPDNEMQSVIDPIIDDLNERIIRSTLKVSEIDFLDLRGKTVDHAWYDDMHPDTDGFVALTTVFERAMP